MTDPLTITLSATAGFVLGTIFFGGLWWTIRLGMGSPKAALWFFGSMVLRMGIALAGFYFVGGNDWRRMVACLAGFIIARFVVTWLTRESLGMGKGDGHAP